jgi:hypothetical protein
MSFLNPVTSDVLRVLDPVRAHHLATWSKNHANIFDLRLHSINSCPFLSYIPAYLTKRQDVGEWANWLYGFFGIKHQEERKLPWRKCDCEKQGS